MEDDPRLKRIEQLEAELEGIANDLVSLKELHGVAPLAALFALPPGEWRTLDQLAPSYQLGAQRGESVARLLMDLHVTWLPEPSDRQSKFAIVVFYFDADDVWWKKVVLFNRVALTHD